MIEQSTSNISKMTESVASEDIGGIFKDYENVRLHSLGEKKNVQGFPKTVAASI